MRLDMVGRQFQGAIDLRWKSYALVMGRMETKPISAHSTESRMAASKAEPEAPFRPWDRPKSYISSSLPALEAAKCAGLQGREAFERYHRALFRALFVESRDISEAPTLLELAKEQGLDVDRFRADLEGGRQKMTVISETLELMSEYGRVASGVPLVVIGDRDPIVGAAPAALYSRVIQRTLEGDKSASLR